MSDLKRIARDAVSRCPHCGNVTGLELSPDLHYRCRICGGPRVPTRGEHLERTLREREHLVKARRAQRAAWLFRALWIVSGVIGGFTFLSTLLRHSFVNPWNCKSRASDGNPPLPMVNVAASVRRPDRASPAR